MKQNQKTNCVWKENDPNGPMPLTWDAECGLCWYLEEGRPGDHQMHYCPKCGKPLCDVVFNDEFDTE